MRRPVAYYATLFGSVILTNVAIYFAATRLLDLPTTASFRFLALCTVLMLVVAMPAVYRNARRSTSMMEGTPPSRSATSGARSAIRILGPVICSLLVAVSIYGLATGALVAGVVSAIFAAVVAAVASHWFQRSLREERQRGRRDGPAST